MENLEETIKNAIEKSLPLQVGEVLKKRLEQAEKDSVTIEKQQEELLIKSNAINEFIKEIAEYKKMDERNATVAAREHTVSESERNLKIATLEFQLSSEKEKTEFSKNIALGLVRNAEYRKTIFDIENGQSFQDGNGNWIYPNTTKNFKETKSQE